MPNNEKNTFMSILASDIKILIKLMDRLDDNKNVKSFKSELEKGLMTGIDIPTIKFSSNCLEVYSDIVYIIEDGDDVNELEYIFSNVDNIIKILKYPKNIFFIK